MTRLVSQVFVLCLWFPMQVCCQSKISSELQILLDKEGKVTALVSFDGIEDICNISTSKPPSALAADRSMILTTLRATLQKKMQNSQNGVYDLLSKQKSASTVQFTQFWITNQMLIREAGSDLIQEISKDPKVTLITEEPKVKPVEDKNLNLGKQSSKDRPKPTGEPQPNLKLLKVPEAWELLGGQKGDGIVVGIIDSGVHGTHENLQHSFLGEFGWLDPTEKAKPEPYDPSAYGHGTHVTGFITGAQGVGVAPNAKWMACRYNGLDGVHFFEQIMKCAEFMVCPTLHNGTNPDCSKAPHIVNNSWGILGYLMGHISVYPHIKTMNSLIDCWQTAGIIPVFALGNEGYLNCSGARYPAYSEKVIGVGNTALNDSVMPSSSRGPTPDGKIAPDISAPGTNLLGPVPCNDCYTDDMEGTSFAAPHVAGAIALLLNKNKELKFDQIREMLRQSAEKIPQTPGEGEYDNCGNTTVDQFPNNLIGYGRLNVLSLLNMDPPAL